MNLAKLFFPAIDCHDLLNILKWLQENKPDLLRTGEITFIKRKKHIYSLTIQSGVVDFDLSLHVQAGFVRLTEESTSDMQW